ncbi:hypothetical protein IWW51_001247 [Coemansia sp. RSA 2702]|nr:hypothetical protein IWW54_001284 [Coemansia sp. RSA 2705]KAJ2319026.1 hypothetical protein IWW52_002210 [Coemansia sp. RSA 2704]KAJ2328357.1 hypothetical protein IWW51_001247 [Coemansia sp. RSA 2702]KAJ2735966.1 hypothetical protein H4R23_002100 [Coemansia sp. Cherry 401B]
MVSVAVLGAAGGIGQPLSLLLMLTPGISRLSLYDIVNMPGVAADISHINSNVSVEHHAGAAQLRRALQGIDIVVIPAGVPRKPGMTRDDLFSVNASIVRELTEAVADTCPRALIAIIANPVNSTVPIAAEVLKSRHVYDPRRLFGVTTLDSVRASRFVRDLRPETDAAELHIPIVGGHSGNTIVPLLSMATPRLELTPAEAEGLVQRIQYGGDEVVKAKEGRGSATLSMAHAAARFTNSLVVAFKGTLTVELALVPLAADPGGAQQIRRFGAGQLEYFAVPVELGQAGVQQIVALPTEPNTLERKGIEIAASVLRDNIDKGVSYITGTK